MTSVISELRSLFGLEARPEVRVQRERWWFQIEFQPEHNMPGLGVVASSGRKSESCSGSRLEFILAKL